MHKNLYGSFNHTYTIKKINIVLEKHTGDLKGIIIIMFFMQKHLLCTHDKTKTKKQEMPSCSKTLDPWHLDFSL